MKKLTKLDIYDNSIVNLSNDFRAHYGLKTAHKPLGIALKKHIVFILIDAMWINILKKYSNFMNDNLLKTIFSVFPSTTTAAITSIHTWLSPYEHGNISRITNMKEYWTTGSPLPFIDRTYSKINRNTWDEFFDSTFDYYHLSNKNIYEPIKNCYAYLPEWILDTYYTKSYLKWCDWIYGCSSFLDENTISQICNNIKKSKNTFQHVYWDRLDNIQHEFWIHSEQVNYEIKKIDEKLECLVNKFKEDAQSDISIVITADHWHTCVKKEDEIDLNEINYLPGLLTIPATGDSRVVFLYPREWKKNLLLSKLEKDSKKFHILTKEEFIKSWLLWWWEMHKFLEDRIWDINLIAKENYRFWNYLINEKDFYEPGIHSGLSDDEMNVPLIMINL